MTNADDDDDDEMNIYAKISTHENAIANRTYRSLASLIMA